MKIKPAHHIIAFLGKGGVGKTALAALSCHLLAGESEQKLLLIDADPALGLTMALGANPHRTIAEARQEMISNARLAQNENDKQQMALAVDYLILETLTELDGFSLLTMGRSDSSGCYCSINSLLRDSIEALAENFDYIIIDAEAGIEQVSREVTSKVSHPLIITDSTLRGVATAQAINSALQLTAQAAPAGVIFNRCDRPDPALRKRLERSGIKYLGSVPLDENISRFDLEGRPLLELPPNSKALESFAQILSGLNAS